MASKIILKKSAVSGKVPVLADLEFGEVALNYADGALFYKKADNTIQNLITSGGGGGSSVSSFNTRTGAVTLTSLDVTTALGFTPGVGDVTLTTTQTLTNKTINSGIYSGTIDYSGSQRANTTAIAALDIDATLGNFFTKTITTNSTFTFSNAPASKVYSFVLELTHTSGTITWPANVVWPADTAPTLTTGKVHLFVFITDDGGTKWRGASHINYGT